MIREREHQKMKHQQLSCSLYLQAQWAVGGCTALFGVCRADQCSGLLAAAAVLVRPSGFPILQA